MRIAIDCRQIGDFGTGTYIRNLLWALSRSDGGHSFFLIHTRDDEPRLRGLSDAFTPVLYPAPRITASEEFTFPRLIRKLNVHLTHIPQHRVPLFLPRPYVMTVHDLSTVFYDDARGLLHQARLYRLHRSLHRAARIIAVSRSTSQSVREFESDAASRVRLIYNAPDRVFSDPRSPTPEPERRRILDRYQIHYPFVLYAGRINPRKNIPRLIEAFAVARSTLEKLPAWADLRLIVIGDQIGRHPEVRRAVVHGKMENYVRFLGFIPSETLRVFHEAASAFVFPSLYEGFGLPPLEAMACGTPVVAARVSSLPEVTGDAARMVDPENLFDIARGITDVLTDDKLRAELIARGHRQAALYSWNRTAREVLEVYREVGPERRMYGVAGYKSRSSSAAR